METKQQLLQYAFHLLARQRYSVDQMKKKLESRKIATLEEVGQVIARLEELEYLDDGAYAQLFIDDHLRRKPQGIQSLRNSLLKKGISKSIITNALDQKDIDESRVAELAVEKKLKILQPFTPMQQKEKLYRFLTSRGFSQNSIFKVLQKIDPN